MKRASRHRGFCAGASIVGALVSCAGTGRASADAVWITASGGNWASSGNWQSGTLPSNGQLTFFDHRAGGTTLAYTVAMNGSFVNQSCKTLNALVNTVTLDFGSATANCSLFGVDGLNPTLKIGGEYADPATLIIQNNGPSISKLTGTDAWVGGGIGPSSTLIVRGSLGRAELSGALRVGKASTGQVTIDQGGFLSCRDLRVGNGTGISGSMTVTGSASTFWLESPINVAIGENGPGSVDILAGGKFQSLSAVPTIFIASSNSSGPSATVTVDGSSSQWQTSCNTMRIGQWGSGSVILSNGGAFNTTFAGGASNIHVGSTSGPSPLTDGYVEIGSECQWSMSGTGTVVVGSDTSPTNSTTGRVTLKGGAMLGSANTIIEVLRFGSLSGYGSVAAASPGIVNHGLLEVGSGVANDFHTLAIAGSLLNTNGGGPNPGGRVSVRVHGDDSGGHDMLSVSGSIQAGGTISIFSDGAIPDGSNTLTLPIVHGTLTLSTPAFPVAILPALPDNRFYRLVYPPAGVEGDVTLIVQSLYNTPGFDGGSASSTLNATVTAADRGDIDGDGLDDLAVTTSDGFVFILTGNGDGTFSQVTQLPVGTDPEGVVIADLDPVNPNDNGLDIVVSNKGSNSLTVYSRNGSGTWFVAANPATGTAPVGLCATDIDADGSVDVAVADSGSNTVSFLRGQSQATISFATRTSHATDNGPWDVDPWDSDNSKGGVQSLVTSNRTAGSMSLLVNNGSGFNAPLNFGSGTGAFQVITGDLNLDGTSDAATLNDDGTMTVFMNDGAGGFLSGAPVPVGDSPLSFTRADLDLDGDLDIAVVADNDSAMPVVKIFRNDTDPFDNNLTLAAPSEVVTTSPRIVLTGKADGDTRPDIITVSGGGPALTTVTSVANSSFCPSDFNRDSFVTGEDFDAYIEEFVLGTFAADFNHDGFTTGEDFDGFVYAFEQGC